MARCRAKIIVWTSAILALLLFVLAYAIFEHYYPVYRNRAIHTIKATASKDALSNMISSHGSAAAATLREYRNKKLIDGLKVISASPPPSLDPPVMVYTTLLLPDSQNGILYLFWLEYDYNVDGILLEFGDGTTETCLIFPIWNRNERDWFNALAHRDFAVRVLDGTPQTMSTLPGIPIIREPLARLQQLRKVRLHLLDGRTSAPCEVFLVPEELRSGITP